MMRLDSRVVLRLAGTFLLALLVVWGGLKLGDPALIVSSLASVNWLFFALALTIFVVNYTLRSLRFSLMLPEAGLSLSFFANISIHGALAYLVPLRLGEFSFPWLVQAHHSGTRLHAMKLLILTRLVDLGFLVFLLSLVLLLRQFPVEGMCRLVACPDPVLSFLKRYGLVLGVLGISGCFGGLFLVHRVFRMSAFLRAPPLILTLCVWLSVALFYWVIALALNIDLSAISVILLLLVLAMGQMLPVQGLAALGAHEFAWVLVLMLDGRRLDAAISLSLSSHFLVIVAVVLLLLLGLLLKQLVRPIENQHEGID